MRLLQDPSGFGIIQTLGSWQVLPTGASLQQPEQHWVLSVQLASSARQVAAATAIGALIETITGTTAAARPKRRTNCLREIRGWEFQLVGGSSSKWNLRS